MSEIADISEKLFFAGQENERLRRESEELRRDKARLDWLESQSNGDRWIARQSEMGRGVRLHNTSSEWFGSPSKTAREAIDAAMTE